MDRKTQWLSMTAGVVLLIFGFKRLFEGEGWTLLILSALIVVFTLSSMIRRRNGE